MKKVILYVYLFLVSFSGYAQEFNGLSFASGFDFDYGWNRLSDVFNEKDMWMREGVFELGYVLEVDELRLKGYGSMKGGDEFSVGIGLDYVVRYGYGSKFFFGGGMFVDVYGEERGFDYVVDVRNELRLVEGVYFYSGVRWLVLSSVLFERGVSGGIKGGLIFYLN